MSFDVRKSRLAEEALQRRLQWVSANYQPAPSVVTKSEVIAFLKAAPSVATKSVSSFSETFMQLRSEACELLADLHRNDPDLPVVPLEATWNFQLSDRAPQPVSADCAPLPLPPFLERIRLPDAADVVDKLRIFVRTFSVKDWKTLYGSLPDIDAEEYAEEEAAEALEGGGAGCAEALLSMTGRSPQRESGVAGAPERRSPAAELRSFFVEMESMLRGHALWRAEVGTPAWDDTLDALDKFLCAKVYSSVFGAHPRAARRDASLDRRLSSLSFVTWRHLDLPNPPEFLAPGWNMAADALSSMDRFDSPADKMACIMNACRIVSTLLALAADSRGSRDGGVGADEFLPALIFVVLHARPPRLYSNLRYISEFCNPQKLNSEGGYFYTNVCSAVAFARNIRPAHLSLSSSEFDSCVRAALGTAERNVGRHRASLTSAQGALSAQPLQDFSAQPLQDSILSNHEPSGEGNDSAKLRQQTTDSCSIEEILERSRQALVLLRRNLAAEAGHGHFAACGVTLQSHSIGGWQYLSSPPELVDVEDRANRLLELYHSAGSELVAMLSLVAPASACL
jgi:hypothetical protein